MRYSIIKIFSIYLKSNTSSIIYRFPIHRFYSDFCVFKRLILKWKPENLKIRIEITEAVCSEMQYGTGATRGEARGDARRGQPHAPRRDRDPTACLRLQLIKFNQCHYDCSVRSATSDQMPVLTPTYTITGSIKRFINETLQSVNILFVSFAITLQM